MPHELEYIVDKAVCYCDKGAKPDFFKGTSNTTVKINSCKVCTKADKKPIANIPSFGVCAISGSACTPAPLEWMDTYKVKVKGEETLLFKSKLACSVGGKIEFMTSGQVPVSQEDLDELMEEHGEEQESEEGLSWWDAAEMIPFVGGVIGMVRSGSKGDWLGFGLSAASLVLDVAGIFSFGGGNVASAAVKGGKLARVGVKAAKAAKAGSKVGKVLKAGTKAAKSAAIALGKKVDDLARATGKVCVFACFTGETLIHTLKGLKRIDEIQIGDEIYSYDEENNAFTIRSVTSLFSDTVQEIIEIETENEIIRTTRTHPFYVNGEYKDAEQIELGENLFSKTGRLAKVISINYVSEEAKVYTFEVEEDHCYFVGNEGILVLNACHIKVFFEAFPHLKGIVSQVHHAIPQKIFRDWPDLFDKTVKNSLDNLRGIPKDGAYALHQSAIHTEWNKFYKYYKNAGIKPSKESVEAMVKKIDDMYGHLFNPPVR